MRMLGSHGVIKKLKAAGLKYMRACGRHVVRGGASIITLSLVVGNYTIALLGNIGRQCGISLKKNRCGMA